MKLLTAIITLSLVGCSQVKDLGQGLLDAPSVITKDLLRIDEDDSVDILQENTINDLEERVLLLESVNESQNELIEINTNNISTNEEAISLVEEMVDSLQNEITELEDELLKLKKRTKARISNLRKRVRRLRGDVRDLERMSQNSISELIDPCGDKAGHQDEILIVLNSGEIIAYFKQGSREMLTVLEDGNYRTTDKQQCRFSIVGGEYVE